jgi:hypothetical protein
MPRPSRSLIGALLLIFTSAAVSFRPALAENLPPLRDIEPVIVKGVFLGAPISQIFVYAQTGAGLRPIPFQIDEVNAAGDYVSSEDNLIDANDEIALLGADLGPLATASPSATLPIEPNFYRIEVSDPDNPARKEYAYIVRSTRISQTSPQDYVSYDEGTRTIEAATYTQTYSAEFAGVEALTLFGGADILDRTKLRIRARVGAITQTLTEESALFPPTAPAIIRDGKVRLIFRQGLANGIAYGASLRSTTLIELPAELTIEQVRLSADHNQNAIGGIYYDENTPAGVVINGVADNVPAAPLNRIWRQISLSSGTLVQIVRLNDTGGTLNRYYKDQITIDNSDTGDKRSFADSGIVLNAPTASTISIENIQHILPGRQPNVGGSVYTIFGRPLTVQVVALPPAAAPNPLFLPTLSR